MDPSNLLRAVSEAAACSKPTDAQRRDLYQACQKLCASLETPIDRLQRVLSDFSMPIVLRIAINLGIFDLFNEEDQADREFDAPEIASLTKTDERLISRVLRFLIAVHMVDVTPQGKCRANSFTKSVQPGSQAHALIVTFSSVFGPPLMSLPGYLQQNENIVPENANRGVFQQVNNTHLHMFDWLSKHKLELDAMHLVMAAPPSKQGGMWTDLIPDKWFADKGSSTEGRHLDQFTVVDIGASSASVLEAFRKRLPIHNVRLVLQDLPEVVESTKQTDTAVEGKIEKMHCSFFERQPILGADVYILARTLHDWPDKEALVILKRIASAMAHTSTLLIYDGVFSDQLELVSLRDAVADIAMMAALSSLERTEGQFRHLLDSAGLELMHIWRSSVPGVKQAVLAVVRADQGFNRAVLPRVA